jgi:hypothetical protein
MLLTTGRIRQHIDVATSDLRDRIQRLEEDQAELRSLLEGERQLSTLAASVSSAAQAALTIGSALERFAGAMRSPLLRGLAGGLARVSTAWRYIDGTFMPESRREEAYRLDYEQYAAGGRARARRASRHSDGTFAATVRGE